jgi:DNA processing protein
VPNTDLNDASHWLCLTLVPGLSPLTLRALLSEFGSPEAVLGAAHAALHKFVPGEVAASIADGGNAAGAQAALAWLNEPDNHIVTLGDADYPQLLLQITDPPPLLYVKGRLDLLNRPSLAIVGSRNSSTQGSENAAEFARALSSAGITIISGLALGIDAAGPSRRARRRREQRGAGRHRPRHCVPGAQQIARARSCGQRHAGL